MKDKLNMLIILAVLLLGVAPSLSYAQKTRSSTHISVDTDNYSWVVNRRDDNQELRIRIKGQAEFNDDYSDLRTLAPNGLFRIEETRAGVSRRFEIETDGQGNQRRSYYVQGRAHDFDSEARQWLAVLMLDVVRQTGYDAPRRVARFYQQGGAAAVLEEVALIKGDYAKRVYLHELSANHRLDPAAAQRVVRFAAQDISSAYEKRQTLMSVAEKYLDDPQTLSEFIAAIATIKSDYERGQIIAAALKRGALNAEQLRGLLQAVARISSDYEKAQALIRLADLQPVEPGALAAFFEAVNSLNSDYEHSRVLLTLLRGKPSEEALKLTLKSVSGISSDYEKARVLLQVAAIGRADEEVRKALVEAARNINSEYERGRVLSATFK
jgi:hypothetical protein